MNIAWNRKQPTPWPGFQGKPPQYLSFVWSVPLCIDPSATLTLYIQSVGCCLTLVALALIGQRSRRLSADRAQQVVLACATFDADGRLMVTPEGLLPCRKITDSYAERSFDDVFTVDHHIFCWMFKASRCWKAIADFLPAIRSHLRSTSTSSSDGRSSSNGIREDDYPTTFKELFCIAANDLANTVHTPFEHIGVLFENIMSTGTLNRNPNLKRLQRLWKPNSLDSIERGRSPAMVGRGQLLFVVRRVNQFESVRLQATGLCLFRGSYPTQDANEQR